MSLGGRCAFRGWSSRVKSVLLRLAGPLQSWGTQGRFEIRDTDREPSKSGVIGLVGAALGMARDDRDKLARLRSLRLAVRVDREGTALRDYHTVGGGDFRGEKHGVWSIQEGRKQTETALTQRYYLADASFLAVLGGENHATVVEIAHALQHPVWSPFLGRRACSPSEPIFAGLVDTSPEDAIRRAPMMVRDRADAPERVRIVVESTSVDGSPRQDEPETFDLYDRRHGLRHVRFDFIARDSLPEATL
jgi:CRISPR system Cascade subunit CasD